jgi:hypothetical protein
MNKIINTSHVVKFGTQADAASFLASMPDAGDPAVLSPAENPQSGSINLATVLIVSAGILLTGYIVFRIIEDQKKVNLINITERKSI